MMLVPIHTVLQMRPTFTHMNTTAADVAAVAAASGAATAASAAASAPTPAAAKEDSGLERVHAQFTRKEVRRPVARAARFSEYNNAMKEDEFVEVELVDATKPFSGGF